MLCAIRERDQSSDGAHGCVWTHYLSSPEYLPSRNAGKKINAKNQHSACSVAFLLSDCFQDILCRMYWTITHPSLLVSEPQSWPLQRSSKWSFWALSNWSSGLPWLLCAYLWTAVWTFIFLLLHPFFLISLFFTICFSLYDFFWNSKL